ncbi:hypothetical protein BGX29_010962 [Mortierella sp. GBA35]|nr:hypothetical protein BGX23_010514 [Mortierella sp. AD031]KAF9091393.1 hypothetical protein BGX29_010962 [Mortierella sp. GBA35]
MGNNNDNKASSVVTTTITTTDTGNSLAILAEMLQSELKRKTDDLHDIREAYQEILLDWTDERPSYQQRLEDAAAKIEGEIVEFRREIGSLLVTHSRSAATPSE